MFGKYKRLEKRIAALELQLQEQPLTKGNDAIQAISESEVFPFQLKR